MQRGLGWGGRSGGPCWTGRAWALCSSAALLLGCAASAPPKARDPASITQKPGGNQGLAGLLQAAQKAEAAGDWARAESEYARAERQGHSPASRAELGLITGRYHELWNEWGESKDLHLVYLSAQALRRVGQVERAQQHLALGFGWKEDALEQGSCLPASEAKPEEVSLRARALLLRGELELEMGQRDRAKNSLGALLACAQAAREESAPPLLVYAGRAASLLREHELGNDLFNAAETRLDEQRFPREQRDLLLFRGALFLEKNDPGQAQEIGEDLQRLFPQQLEVKAFLAQLLSETQFDFAATEQAAQAILKDNPRHTGALFLLAGTELRDMNLKASAAYLERGLRVNPRDVDLLSLRAALRFLSEDRAGFEAQLAELQQLSPGNVRPYLVVAEYAEWEHRYPDLEKLMRRATRLDRDAAELRTRLGLTLVRAGSDAAGVVELNRAYDLDPYNVRVVNTLNLYEKLVVENYVSVEQGPFRYRFPKDAAELLQRYVPRLVEQAYHEMRARYGYTPPWPIDIELYQTPEQFAVRTSGVPQIGIQGVCFGHKLATVSPLGAPGNLGMTLWHELGHVFHIGLSNYRVPRYLTEGMAEWETARRGVGWSRELDRELFEVRRDGALPPLSQMSRAFTHARRGQDVAAAYYASGILSEWLVERFGQERTVAVLREMGREKLAQQVVPEVLGQSWAELDAGFEAHLTEKLRPLAQQFTPQSPRDELSELRPLLQKNPHDADLRLRLALSLLAEGEVKEAKSVLATLVYGSSARIDAGQLVHLGGDVPIRDEEAERRAVRRVKELLNLTPGSRLIVSGEPATVLASRLDSYQGEMRGRSLHGFIERQTLEPRVDFAAGALSIEFAAAGSARHASAEAVVKAWQSGMDLVPLNEGGWAPLPRGWLEQHGRRVADLLDAKRASANAPLPGYALPGLVQLCADLGQDPPGDLQRLRPLITGFEGIPDAERPSDLQAELRDYQRQGVNWLCFLRDAGLGATLADDMGLGKTLQALCAIRGRTLVVAPRSVLFNWQKEAARFRTKLSSHVYHGPKRALDPNADLTITTYAVMRIDQELLSSQSWDMVILDEAQTIKNPDSQVAQAAYRLNAKFRVTLSGTPVENRLEELWSQFRFTNPGLLGGRQYFQDQYERPIAEGKPDAARSLRSKIRPFLLRRMKSEVAKELPPRTNLSIECNLSEEERAVYDAIRAAGQKEIVERLQAGGNVMQALELLLRLRQAACHSALVPGQQAQGSTKIQELLAALEQAAAEGHKALVFSQWTGFLDLIEPHLKAAELRWLRLDGSTRDRQGVVDGFQTPSGPPILLASLKAGGTGLNLTAADHVFLMDLWWNPAVEDQAADRAHRIGQERPVFVHRLVAKDTVEERIVALQERKRGIADAALGDADQAGGLTREDLLALLE